MSSTPWHAFTDPNHVVNDHLIMTVTGICLTVGILVVTELSQCMKRSATKRTRRARHKHLSEATKDSIKVAPTLETENIQSEENNVESEQNELSIEPQPPALTKSQKRNRKRREKRKKARVAAKLEHDEEIRRRLAGGKGLTE